VNVRLTIICLGVIALFLLPGSNEAQQPIKIPRVGYVSGADPSRPVLGFEVFRQTLRELGYTEGKNVLLEHRVRYDVQKTVAELIQLKVDVLVVIPLQAIRAAKQATKTIPIVMITTQDPVEAGLVDDLSRPGGNITGITSLARDLSGKRLELLKEVLPGISRIGILRDADSSGAAIAFEEYQTAAQPLKLQVQSLEVRAANPDFDSAFQAAAKKRINAVVAVRGRLLNGYAKRIAGSAIHRQLPTMYEGSQFVEAGGFMSYSANEVAQWQRAAVFVDSILKGTKPADLPIEQPTKFELIINLKTAKQIGLTIPPNVLARADRVIR
jgi:putative ABC transport system substrate-binding protein